MLHVLRDKSCATFEINIIDRNEEPTMTINFLRGRLSTDGISDYTDPGLTPEELILTNAS